MIFFRTSSSYLFLYFYVTFFFFITNDFILFYISCHSVMFYILFFTLFVFVPTSCNSFSLSIFASFLAMPEMPPLLAPS